MTGWTLSLIVLSVVLVYIFAYSPHLKFWLQVISGNFNAPTDFTDIDQAEFAISALIAILINWLPLIAAAALVYRFMKRLFYERAKDMRLMDAFFIKDRVIKEAIYNAMSTAMSDADQERLRPLVDGAFAEGSREWLDDWLPDIYGGDETKELIDRLEKDSPGILKRMRGG